MFSECTAALAQDNNLPGIIPSLFYRGRITNRFDYNFFGSTTFITGTSTIDGRQYGFRNSEIYLQPSLVYKHSRELNFAVGYTYVQGNSFSTRTETEQQLWQQAIVEHRALKGLLLHRFRLVENIGRGLSPLFNYQIAFEKPLQGRVLDEGEFYFTCFDEAFINPSGTSGAFQANWSFVGIGYKTSKAGKFEIGPLVQASFNNESQGNNALYLLQLLWISDSQLLNRKR